MDLSSNKMNQNSRFEAFQGNPLIKTNNSRSRTNSTMQKEHSFSNRLASGHNFDELWRGSVNNLMSSDNITEDLIKESVKELEYAMLESKRMLTERDEEINKLRAFIENNKRDDNGTAESLMVVKEQLEKSQRHIVELECELSEIKIKHTREISELKKQILLPQVTEQYGRNLNGALAECTCYCGGNCKSARELFETRKILETVKQKYEHLKRRVKEFRRNAEDNQKKFLQEIEQDEKSTSCSIQ